MTQIYRDLVEHFGTQAATAEALGVDQTSVSGWVRGAFKMSAAVAVRAERATSGAFTKNALCPEVFGEPEHNPAA